MKLSVCANTMSRARFRCRFVLLSILLLPLYLRFFRSFSMRMSELVRLLAMTMVLGSVIYRSCVRRRRNCIAILTGAPLSYLLCEALSLGQSVKAIPLVLAIGSAAALTLCTLWAVRTTRGVESPRLRRSLAIGMLCFRLWILLFALLLAACLYGKYLFRTQQVVAAREISYQQSGAENGVEDYENSLAANLDVISKLEPGVWNECPEEERLEILSAIVRVECRYLGMADAPSLQLAYLPDGTLGMYTNETDTITLSYPYLRAAAASGYGALRVLLHEIFHRYQHRLVDFYHAVGENAQTAPYQKLLLLDRAAVYRTELANYQLPDGSDDSYDAYRSQKLETDAESYANRAVADYYHSIQEYLADD